MNAIHNNTVCEGRLELNFNEQFINGWFAVCDSSFGLEEIQVVCRQLGCNNRNGFRTHILMYVNTVCYYNSSHSQILMMKMYVECPGASFTGDEG